MSFGLYVDLNTLLIVLTWILALSLAFTAGMLVLHSYRNRSPVERLLRGRRFGSA